MVLFLSAVVNGGVVVPLDKELPENEIELSVNRQRQVLLFFTKTN